MDSFDHVINTLHTHRQLRDRGLSNRKIQTQFESGVLTRIRRGIYVETATLRQLKPWERYALDIRALYLRSPTLVFSHQSALVIHSIATISNPKKIHFYGGIQSRNTPVGSSNHPFLHDDLPFIQYYSGMRTTIIATTLIDCAKTMPFEEAVIAADSALHQGLISLDDLGESMRGYSGRNKAAVWRVASAMSCLAESPGETLCRLFLDEVGLEYAEQYWVELDGARYRGDFRLKRSGAFVEFDGEHKYTDYGDGAQVLFKERERERRFINSGLPIFRVKWEDLRGNRILLRKRLFAFLERLPG